MNGKVCACAGLEPDDLPFGSDETDKRCILLKKRLCRCLKDLIVQEGVRHFISDMTRGFGTLFVETVLALRDEMYPQITVEAALPYETQAEDWSEAQRDRYFALVERCDTETMLQTAYTPQSAERCARYLVERCDYLVAVRAGGGEQSIVRRARQCGKTVRYVGTEE